MYGCHPMAGASVPSDRMKTRLAMALSVAGVLAAGSAAALANTQILDGGDTASGA